MKPHAFVVLRPGRVAAEELEVELCDFVRRRLAWYKAPRWVELVEGLPKTATGKLQRFRLCAGEVASTRS